MSRRRSNVPHCNKDGQRRKLNRFRSMVSVMRMYHFIMNLIPRVTFVLLERLWLFS